jgi:PAS domain S-box-containing protein
VVGHRTHLLEASWAKVLDHLGEAVIVMDEDRILRHVNDAARRLLGYEEGHAVGSRCRLTTRGVDCENACPLTFALQAGLDRVEDFETVYRNVDGQAVRLRVTVIPMTGSNGDFKGAVEILRPLDPDPGFFMCGRSAAARAMRQRAAELARSRAHVLLAGPAPACRDVALALHRYSGLAPELFRDWTGSWDDIGPWPPGTVYACGDDAESLLRSSPPDGWRLIVGAARRRPCDSGFELFELAELDKLESDLESMVTRWVAELAPAVQMTPAALGELTRLARDGGLGELEGVICEMGCGSGGTVDAEDLPCGQTSLLDELLQAEKPMAALEERLLRAALERCDWRMQEAAEKVGVSRVTLWRKMKDLGIERP